MKFFRGKHNNTCYINLYGKTVNSYCYHCYILNLADVHKFIDDGINGESGRGVYIQFAAIFATVGGDGVDRDE